jgi:hypothetical protein
LDEFIQDLNKSSQASLPIRAPPSKEEHFYREAFTGLKQRPATSGPAAENPESSTSKVVWDVAAAAWANLQKNPLFSTYPDAGARSVFAKSQIIIWAVEG